MGHGEAITSLFVLVLIRLVKCSQAWPRINMLLPAVAELRGSGQTALSWADCLNTSRVGGKKCSSKRGIKARNNGFCLLLSHCG